MISIKTNLSAPLGESTVVSPRVPSFGNSKFHRLAVLFSVMLVALCALVVLPGARAGAESPPNFPPSQTVVDNAHILGDQVGQLEADLNNATVQLYVVTTQSFTNPTNPTSWAGAAAEQSGISGNAAVLAISVNGDNRKFGISYSNSVRARLDQNKANNIQRAFTSTLSGKEATAQNLSQAILNTNAALQDAYSGGSGKAKSTGNGAGTTMLFIGVLVVAAVVIFFVVRSRRAKARLPQAVGTGPGAGATTGVPVSIDPLDQVSVEQLRAQAGKLLIAADDAIKSSEQELGFAQAQYGDAAVTTFAEDINRAKGALGESFRLQQQLDDDIPDTEPQQREWLKQIIRNCESVNQSLQSHKTDFDNLRELERNAPEALVKVEQEAQTVKGQLGEATGKLQQLASSYADSALTQVQDNVTQAQERLQFVATSAQTAREKLAANDPSTAAVAVRAAEESVYQAKLLVDAIAKADTDLVSARQNLESAVGGAAQDLAEARALVASGQHPELAPGVQGVQSALEQIKAALGSGRIDPFALTAQLAASTQALQKPLASVRDQQEQIKRAGASLQQWISSAQAQISGTEDFIRARRGGVGPEARTRLAEASRNLQEAITLQSSDPVRALTFAQQADALARDAANAAQNDVDQFSNQGGGYGGYGGGLFGGGSRGGGMGGALLGGILLGGILNGGHGNSDNNDGGFFGGGGFGGFGDGGSFGGGDGGGFGGFGGGDGNF